MSDQWTGAEADLIAAELARVVIGGRGPRRVEQRMDLPGHLARHMIAQRLFATDIGKQLLPAMQGVVDAVKRMFVTNPELFDAVTE